MQLNKEFNLKRHKCKAVYIVCLPSYVLIKMNYYKKRQI